MKLYMFQLYGQYPMDIVHTNGNGHYNIDGHHTGNYSQTENVGSHYGSMLWAFVLLSCGHTSVRTDSLARYTRYVSGLRTSPSMEVAEMLKCLVLPMGT